jgi:hypothetical protein
MILNAPAVYDRADVFWHVFLTVNLAAISTIAPQ